LAEKVVVVGWTRTGLLALGALAGVLAAALGIHFLKEAGVVA